MRRRPFDDLGRPADRQPAHAERVVDQGPGTHFNRSRREDPKTQPWRSDRLQVAGVREKRKHLVDRPIDPLFPRELHDECRMRVEGVSKDEGIPNSWNVEWQQVGKFELAHGESLDELVILGGQAEIRGKVARLTVKGGQVRIHSSAEITQELVNIGGDLEIDPGAKVHHGPSQVFSPFHRSFDLFLNSANEFNLFDLVGSSVFLWGFRFFKIFFLLCVGLLVVRLAPDLFLEVQRNIREDFFGAGLAGFLYLVAYLPVALFLVVTVFGISLLPVQFLLTSYLSAMGCVAAMQVIVNKLGIFRERHELMLVCLGILIFEIFGWIPYIGALAQFAITVLGIGASFLVLWERVRRRRVV